MPDNSNECCKELAGEAVEDAPRAFEFEESLLFFSKFPRMGDHGTAGAASGVLDVQHLVKQDILHGARRNAGTIHPTIEQNLIRPWIVTAKLPPPAPGAPSDVRALQLAGKVFSIELIEKSFQIEVFSAGSGGRQANPSAAHAIHAAARPRLPGRPAALFAIGRRSERKQLPHAAESSAPGWSKDKTPRGSAAAGLRNRAA